jgi:hypothetical protein
MQKMLAGPRHITYFELVPNADVTTALEKLLRPLSRELSLELARALAKIKADPETQARYEQLAEGNTEGRLTPEEQAELESFVRANTLLGIVKAEAQVYLMNPKAA